LLGASLPSNFAALVQAEMRARSVTQDLVAAELGISQPQLADTPSPVVSDYRLTIA
jgi:hypothetical protein